MREVPGRGRGVVWAAAGVSLCRPRGPATGRCRDPHVTAQLERIDVLARLTWQFERTSARLEGGGCTLTSRPLPTRKPRSALLAEWGWRGNLLGRLRHSPEFAEGTRWLCRYSGGDKQG